MSLTAKARQQMKAKGHALHPIVIVAGKGLADTVLEEIRRALHDHELIKVKFAVGDRTARQQVIDDMCAQCGCELVQQIGHIALVYKENPAAKLGLSNVRGTD